MSQNLSPDVPTRPVAAQSKWWIVGAVFVLLGAWEWAFHRWFMEVPMVIGHRLNALIAAALVTGVLLASFALIQRYEQRLAVAAEALRQANEALRALEAERDTRLVDLASDLAVALVDVVDRCEVARSFPEAIDASEEFAAISARAGELGLVLRSIIALKQEAASRTASLPAILEEYDRRREAHPERLRLSGTAASGLLH